MVVAPLTRLEVGQALLGLPTAPLQAPGEERAVVEDGVLRLAAPLRGGEALHLLLPKTPA